MQDEDKKEEKVDVYRIINRINELDRDSEEDYSQKQLKYNDGFISNMDVPAKKKKRILGLNDSREHDFDIWFEWNYDLITVSM